MWMAFAIRPSRLASMPQRDVGGITTVRGAHQIEVDRRGVPSNGPIVERGAPALVDLHSL